MRFPTYTTRDLNGKQKTLPDDFTGSLTLAIIAYEDWQQQAVNSWVPLLDRLEQQMDAFHYVEVPVVGMMGALSGMQLDFFMRAGIRDHQTRARTLTLYVDRAKFCRQLEIPTQKSIALLLIDPTGEVIWQARGAYHEETARALQAAVDGAVPQLSNPGNDFSQ